MPQNYIYFKGGSWGDIAGRIVNNGNTIGDDIQAKLKLHHKFSKNEVQDLPVATIVGHSLLALSFGYNNYQVVINDPKLRELASRRFASVNNMNSISESLRAYYPDNLYKTIHNLPLEKQIDLLAKKYKYDVTIDAVPLDFSCVFDREKFINLLSKHFYFNKQKAIYTWNIWYHKQKEIDCCV